LRELVDGLVVSCGIVVILKEIKKEKSMKGPAGRWYIILHTPFCFALGAALEAPLTSRHFQKFNI